VVRVGDEESDKINLMRGVKQGCVLSPMIFEARYENEITDWYRV
jgi:hypothetical protein